MREEQLILFGFNNALDIFSLNILIDNLADDIQAGKVDSEVDCKLAECWLKGCEQWHKVQLCLEANYPWCTLGADSLAGLFNIFINDLNDGTSARSAGLQMIGSWEE